MDRRWSVHVNDFGHSPLDRLFTSEQARCVAPFTLALYREMESDSNFHQLGSVMGWAYAEVLGLPFEVGHYYLYIPKTGWPGRCRRLSFCMAALAISKPTPGSGPNWPNKVKIIVGKKVNQVHPIHGVVVPLNFNPVALVISREMGGDVLSAANKTLMIVGGGVNQVAQNFLF